MRKIVFVVAVVLAAGLVLAGCGGGAELGTDDNPIVWAFVPSGESETVTTGAEGLAALLEDETGYVFDILVTTEYAGAIEAMCSDPSEAHMSSLNTFSYVLASERCGVEAALVATRFGSASYNGQIIVRADSGIASLEDLAGKTFCRADPLSTSSWIIPSLYLRAAGIDPDTDLAEIVDSGSHDAVVAAVYNGDCDAGATYVDARSTLEEAHGDVMDVVVVVNISDDIPNDGVQFAPDVDAEMKTKIVDALLGLTESEEGLAVLDAAYSWAGLEKHGDEFYDPFRQVLQASGLNIEDMQ